ncbi:Oxysterol-binding protein 3 [Lithohypha guttulata]|uniref:Oxysterol-binding protein 3 n=1 Tax=Lithohypha guttulata TaxID=1690604 RepID=UPI002DE0DA26|nr:Oxysterol-binding protein 3 [Lithohypha guttulata]
MEQIEIHSRSYLLRWVHAKSNTTISWTVQPHKRSINLGLFKHPGALASLPSVGGLPHLSTVSSRNDDENLEQPEVVDRLESIGLRQVLKLGKCEADKFTQSRYDVPNGEGGHYAIVFDNTFSKSTGKMVTFFLLTYPTNAQHQISFGAQSHQHGSAMASAMTLAPSMSKKSPRIGPKQSVDSLKLASELTPRSTPTGSAPKLAVADSAQVFQGILHKRRRKRGQGYARRFFSLDYTSSTLSYYHDRNSSALRGAIPLSLAAIGANAKTREISIDSGAEIWHLRAHNAEDFQDWKTALEKASQARLDNNDPQFNIDAIQTFQSSMSSGLNWERLEALLSKISGTRDAVRRLCSDAERYATPAQTPSYDGAQPATPDREEASYFPEERKAFWKRKASTNETKSNIFKRSVSTQLAVPSITNSQNAIASPGIGDNMKQILNNLDTVIADFAALLGDAKPQNAFAVPQSAVSRMSIESQEYFDAEDRTLTRSNTQLLQIQDEDTSDTEDKRSGDSDTSSSVDENDTAGNRAFRSGSLSSLMPPPAKSLTPLPLDRVKRRTTIKEPTIMPPSLIGFLRKNVGKDLSTISMPVSANEPTSLLHKAAENFEYSELLDKATTLNDVADRLLHITAFAISSLSNARVKERNIRKPFNPMLGETYELVREDKNFRFISEKVSHRPVQLAFYAEGKNWGVGQSPLPSQKFWGKSSEIITDGKVRVALHNVAESYSWAPPTCFLRNIIAGEKYVEPVGKLSVVNETTGWQCVVTFKVKGMFSGRSEEVDVQMVDQNGLEQPLGLSGAWTSHLAVKENGRVDATKEIWRVGPLVDRPEKHYGMTKFAAELNEITPVEEGKLPPTDSRLRADQRALENGQYDNAERLKNEIEEGQRARRRELEAAGEEWTPKFFVKVNNGPDGETVWKPKSSGSEGYWERRAKGDWNGIVDVLGTGMTVHKQEPGRF